MGGVSPTPGTPGGIPLGLLMSLGDVKKRGPKSDHWLQHREGTRRALDSRCPLCGDDFRLEFQIAESHTWGCTMGQGSRRTQVWPPRAPCTGRAPCGLSSAALQAHDQAAERVCAHRQGQRVVRGPHSGGRTGGLAWTSSVRSHRDPGVGQDMCTQRSPPANSSCEQMGCRFPACPGPGRGRHVGLLAAETGVEVLGMQHLAVLGRGGAAGRDWTGVGVRDSTGTDPEAPG